MPNVTQGFETAALSVAELWIAGEGYSYPLRLELRSLWPDLGAALDELATIAADAV